MFTSQISFLYYKNLNEAIKFYEDIFNFELVIDQGWAKIYKITEGAHIGLVNEQRGYFNWEKNKTVMITLVVKTPEDVDKWYNKLCNANVKCLSKPKDIDEIDIRAFLIEDPEGYVIEIQHFFDR